MCVGVREIEREGACESHTNRYQRDGVLCLRKRKIFHNESDS